MYVTVKERGLGDFSGGPVAKTPSQMLQLRSGRAKKYIYIFFKKGEWTWMHMNQGTKK